MSSDRPAVVDIGLNLTHKSFQKDFDQVVQRAWDAGVVQMVLTGTTVAASDEAIALAERYPGQMFATAGVHPHHANDFDDAAQDALRCLAQRPEVAAIGECGLDFFRNFSTPEAQLEAFQRQLDLAANLGMPVFLHERDAHTDFSRLLRARITDLPAAVVHCFTGSRAALDDYLEMGCLIGVTGWVCDERRGEALRELVPLIPDERLLIETDAPFLLPRDLKPKPKENRNEPCFLPHVGQTVAGLRGVSYEHLAGVTTANARNFFGLPDPE